MLAAGLWLCACAPTDPDAAAPLSGTTADGDVGPADPVDPFDIPAAAGGSYRLAPGDIVAITVLGQPDLTGLQEVAQDGTVTMPLIGPVPALGETTDGLSQSITARLADGFLRAPAVAVRLEEYRPIFVTGAVSSGGAYPYRPGLTVLQAVALAGGVNPADATTQRFEITRRGPSGALATGSVVGTDPIRPGDTLQVFARRAVFGGG